MPGVVTLTLIDALGDTDEVLVTVMEDKATKIATVDSDGNSSTARISGGITTDNGLSYSGFVSEGDEIKIVLTIEPEADYIGENANIIVAIEDITSGQLFLLRSDFELVELDLANLEFFNSLNLAASNRIDILEPIGGSITIGPAFIGLEYNFHIAYQLSSGGPIYYNNEPVVLQVN